MCWVLVVDGVRDKLDSMNLMENQHHHHHHQVMETNDVKRGSGGMCLHVSACVCMGLHVSVCVCSPPTITTTTTSATTITTTTTTSTTTTSTMSLWCRQLQGDCTAYASLQRKTATPLVCHCGRKEATYIHTDDPTRE